MVDKKIFSKKMNVSKTIENTLVLLGPMILELGAEVVGLIPSTPWGKILAGIVGMALYSFKNWLKISRPCK